METQELVENVKTNQKVQLVKGNFTPSEAYDVIISMIDKKINFHKVKRLQNWEENHGCEMSQVDCRIKELQEEKRIVKEFISNTRAQGCNLKINGVLEISVTEE